MKWAVWIVALPVLYVLSIGPVAYIKTRSDLGPGYVKGSSNVGILMGYVFFAGAWGPSEYSRLPQWAPTVYAPLISLVRSDQAPGKWVNDYTAWWVSLAY